MATTSYGTPYVASSDLVSGYPTVSSNLATRIDDISIKGNGVNAITSAGYTLVLTDAGKLVTVSNASAQNLTIPLNSSVAFPTGTTIDVLCIGAGTWTVTATGGVTLNGTTAVPTGKQVRLTKTATDTWYSQPYGAGGLTLITSAALSGSQVIVSNCFTATYDHYKIIIAGTASASGSGLMRMSNSGTPITTATYDRQLFTANNSTLFGGRDVNQTAAWYGSMNTTWTGNEITIYGPKLTVPTMWHATSADPGSASYVQSMVCREQGSTAYDGFAILPASGTFSTGNVYVYGIARS